MIRCSGIEQRYLQRTRTMLTVHQAIRSQNLGANGCYTESLCQPFLIGLRSDGVVPDQAKLTSVNVVG